MFYFTEALCQTINYADDDSLSKIYYDINVIRVEFEIVSGVAKQLFKHENNEH